MLSERRIYELRALSRFCTASNASLLLSFVIYYLLSRSMDWKAPPVPLRRLYDHGHLVFYEKRVALAFSALVAIRLWRRSTLDQFVSEMKYYLRNITTFGLVFVDYRLALILGLWHLLSYLLIPRGRPTDLGKVDTLTPSSLDRQAMNENSKETWLVMLNAPWSKTCANAWHTFVSLSNDYSSEKFRFGELEVSRWPKIAKKFDVIIESVPTQLPTFLLFKQGKLVKRYPAKDEDWPESFRLRSILVGVFELDMVMAKEM